ncbi:putative neurotransmitter transporter [Aplysia californica]|uniref:Transporter n=1 Tax=Aplysia californica TaxID=6500 RepID=D2CFJ0_APLCA|nr:putative neurotransmitter transporter [Aplysia californica]ABD17758.1 putative neurotransmitter transporter [Aplysia californica]
MEGTKPGWRTAVDPPSSDRTSSSTLESPKYKMEQREQWSKKIDFLLACIGFSVGLGNVWRFPFLCYRNGGGAFLIPYFVAVVLGGVPMFFLEVSLGQFMSEGGIGPWKIAPLFQGIGYATAMIVFLLNCEYNVILSWAFYYIFSSFTSVLPWSHCDNSWNTPNCTTFEKNMSEIASTTTTTASPSDAATTRETTDLASPSLLGNLTSGDVMMSVISAGMNATSGVNASGLETSVVLPDSVTEFWEVMYVTAPSPYVFMFILLIRGLTLEGASLGLEYYLNPDWSRLWDAQVWVDAGTQIFFSYSISLGTLTALGSYNKFHHNCFRDSIIFATVNSLTSILAGFVIFSVLGFMAHRQNLSVKDVAESGPGLAFIAYPEAVSQMPLAPAWSIVFFIMIILLGLDSQFVGVEGFITACVDLHPEFLRRKYRKEIFTAIICVICFLIGLSMVTEGGMYVFQLFDYYSASRIVLLVAAIECFVVGYIYGIDRFIDNLVTMFGFQGPRFTRVFRAVTKTFWMFLTPVFTLAIFILGCISYSELSYKRKSGTYQYPDWAIAVGWMLAGISIIFIPIIMIQRVLVTPGTLIERLQYLAKPHSKRHQLRPNEDMSRVVLVEDEFFDILDQKMEEEKFMPEHCAPSFTLETLSGKDLEANAGTYPDTKDGAANRLINNYNV